MTKFAYIFHEIKLMDGWMSGLMDGLLDGFELWMDYWMDLNDGMDGRMEMIHVLYFHSK